MEDFVERGVEVVQYPLPKAVQTYELIYLRLPRLIIISQLDALLGVELDPATGKPASVRKLDVPCGPNQKPHGLLASKLIPDVFWCAIQFENVVLEMEFCRWKLSVTRRLEMPSHVRGPHCMTRDGDDLWVSCKDSGHLVKLHPFSGEPAVVYRTSHRPIFVAATSDYVYCSLDLSSKIFCLHKSSGVQSEVCVKEGGETPVGLVTGPDGHAWFTLMGGNGTFGRLTGTSIQWFHLGTRVEGLIHLAFDGDVQSVDGVRMMRMILLGSSMDASSMAMCSDLVAVAIIRLHEEKPKIAWERVIVLPCNDAAAYRVLLHGGGAFVTEMTKSSMAHVSLGLGIGREIDAALAREVPEALGIEAPADAAEDDARGEER